MKNGRKSSSLVKSHFIRLYQVPLPPCSILTEVTLLEVKVVQKTSKLAFKQKKEDISFPHLDFGMSLWYAWYAILRLQIYDELEVGQLNKAPFTEIRTFLGSHSVFFCLFHEQKQWFCFCRTVRMSKSITGQNRSPIVWFWYVVLKM